MLTCHLAQPQTVKFYFLKADDKIHQINMLEIKFVKKIKIKNTNSENSFILSSNFKYYTW